MTDSFVTQCPHCQTSFRVTHHQLSVARGVVRCGNCLQVFNAARQLLEQSRAATPQAPAPELPAALAPLPAEPAAPPAQWADTDQALDAVDLDQELARLERRSPGDRRTASAEPALSAQRDEHGSDALAEQPFGTATDEPAEPIGERSDAPVLLEQPPLAERAAASDARTEPTLGNAEFDLDDEPPVRPLAADDSPEAHHDPLPADDEPAPAAGLSARDDEDDDQALHLAADERLEPALAARRAAPAASSRQPLVDVVDDPLQLGWEKPAPNWGKRLLWGTLTLLAAGLLAFQYIWYHFDEMARQDQYRPWFQQLCPMLGCQVPTRVDISRIKSSNLVVRSHPDFKGALIVDAIIYNRASFAQPFPLLELRFADLNGQLIASRRFKPSEYLSGELAGRGEMPSQTPIRIALDILDPGPKAVNYSLSFRSPE